MNITFSKFERMTHYYRQYFYNSEGKAMGCILRETERPWSDCNDEVTTHYHLTLWFDKLPEGCESEIIFPVTDAAGIVTEIGANMTADDFSNPAKVAELHAAYLSNYFNGKNLGESSKTARTAGAKVKRFVKEIAKLN